MVPENIYTPTTEGHWKFRGGGLNKIFKGKYERKLEFPEGGGVKPKKTLRGGSMGIFWFLEHHISLNTLQAGSFCHGTVRGEAARNKWFSFAALPLWLENTPIIGRAVN